MHQSKECLVKFKMQEFEISSAMDRFTSRSPTDRGKKAQPHQTGWSTLPHAKKRRPREVDSQVVIPNSPLI